MSKMLHAEDAHPGADANPHKLESDQIQQHALEEALQKSDKYPYNLEQLQDRPKLVAGITRHFHRTKRNALISVDGLSGFRKTFYLNTQVRTSWFDCEIGREIEEEEIRSMRVLEEKLGVKGSIFTPTADPFCRFIILKSSLPASPQLKITEEMLLKILTYHHVSPYYLGLLSHITYDPGSGATGIPFSSIRCMQLCSWSSSTSPTSAILGRSGFQYQLIFELKTVFNPKDTEYDGSTTETTSDADEPEHWPLSQYALYHQFDISTGKCLWIMTAANNEAVAQFKDVYDIKSALGLSQQSTPFPAERPITDCFKSTLSVLTWLGDWSLSEYDSYITTIDERLQELDQTTKKSTFRIEDITLKTISIYMETLDKLIIALKSNLRIFQSLLRFYGETLVKDKKLETHPFMLPGSESRASAEEHIDKFKLNMKSISETIEEMIGQANALKEMGTRRENTTHRVLQNRDTATMKELAVQTTIIATLSLFLLPVSVISAIFSTDIVRFQGMTGYLGNWSAPAAVWWASATVIATSLVGLIGESWRRKSKTPPPNPKTVMYRTSAAHTIFFDRFLHVIWAKFRLRFHNTVDKSRYWIRWYKTKVHHKIVVKLKKSEKQNSPGTDQADQNGGDEAKSSSHPVSAGAEHRISTITENQAVEEEIIEKKVEHREEINEVTQAVAEGESSGTKSFENGSLMEEGAVVRVVEAGSSRPK
ncbi:hypothetical protein QBC35DRAFT_508587 [Podospora australis]|uniref:CorA-like transporter domain-containing protein n=1 Tax=Podospora australis TaxID=1536484 RepID=A0AAN6WN14_9PEZI|nr:hypothetical protein QBC35DRAFT_508587 [Podospora australis]